MEQRTPARRIVPRIGAALTAFIALLFIVSLCCFIKWDSPSTRGKVSYGFELTSGVLCLGRTMDARLADTSFGSLRVEGPQDSMPLPLPIIYGEGGTLALFMPLWIPLALAAVPTVVVALRRRKARRVGCCPSCGYDLAGNTTGVCPECGN